MSGTAGPASATDGAPQNAEELFRHHLRTIDKIHAKWGNAGIERHRDNIERTTLVSLFSGLGGAEMVMMQNYLACSYKCIQLGLRPPSGPPKMLVACDNNIECQRVLTQHSEPPEFIVDNLLRFVSPACTAAP